MDFVTNVISSSISAVILRYPLPFFIELLPTYLQREVEEKVVSKLIDVIYWIERTVGFRYDSFISDSFNSNSSCSISTDSKEGSSLNLRFSGTLFEQVH